MRYTTRKKNEASKPTTEKSEQSLKTNQSKKSSNKPNKIKEFFKPQLEEGEELPTLIKREKNVYINDTGYSQEFVDVDDIVNGLIITKTGSIVKLLEVLPLNFTEKSENEQEMIVSNFGFGFKQCPTNCHIKIVKTTTDMTPFVDHIRSLNQNETNQRLKERVEDYINNTLSLQSSDTSVKKRFFFIFEYEGEGEKKRKSDFWDDIESTIYQDTRAVISALRSTGNYVIDYGRNQGKLIAEILYSFYNPFSSKEETFDQRYEKVMEGKNYYNLINKPLSTPVDNYLAPRGMSFGNFDYVQIDGGYQTYLMLKDTAYPSTCMPGYLTDVFMANLKDYDIDILTHQKQAREMSINLLERVETINKGIALDKTGNEQKYENLISKASNAKFIRHALKDNDEELYDVNIIITIRSLSLNELRKEVDNFKRKMRSQSLYFEDCFLVTNEYFRMTQPLMYRHNAILKENSRNMTNSSLAVLYCFSTLDMFDPKGCCMGITVPGSSLFSINTYDSRMFVSPHIMLIGCTGAGKTFTELSLSNRYKMSLGARLFYILPVKGHEYRKSILSMGGEYIQLFPGSEACINIMELRPENMDFNEEDLSEDDIEEMKTSLLSRKMATLTTFFHMIASNYNSSISAEEVAELNTQLRKLYARFGITEDNNSIWENKEKRILKRMPIISDWYESIKDNPILSKKATVLKTWVEGSCSNMNGQTNVDMTNKVIAFDVNEDKIGEDLLPAFMYLAFDLCYSACRENKDEKCCLVLDEIWKLLVLDECAKIIAKSIRLLRSTSTACFMATQDIESCLSNSYGQTLLTQSSTKIILRVTPEETRILEKYIELSEENKSRLETMPRGTGMFFFNRERIFVNMVASQLEIELYNTDSEVRKRLKAKESHI